MWIIVAAITVAVLIVSWHRYMVAFREWKAREQAIQDWLDEQQSEQYRRNR